MSVTDIEKAPEDEWTASPLATIANTSTTSYEDLMSGPLAVVEGYALTDKATLLGVPFIITGVTFRKPSTESKRDFVSVEAVTMQSGAIVFNDGSTGIRRQLVEYLQVNDLLPEGDPDVQLAYADDADAIEYKFAGSANVAPLRCPRGLRKSDYVGPEGDATTFYLG